MARPRSQTDAIRYPLDELMGTHAGVRLLRLLAYDVDGPLSAPDAAERAGLTPSAARTTLEALARTGFVVRIGGGRKMYQVREGDQLVEARAATGLRIRRAIWTSGG
jgi:DNA-binding IclR family transcriptional regulator